MSVPKASEDLHKYKAWRMSLTPLPVGTIVRWTDERHYAGSTKAGDIVRGQMFILEGTRDPLFGVNECDADQIYIGTQCSKTGKKYKRDFFVSVEGIARWIAEYRMEIVNL